MLVLASCSQTPKETTPEEPKPALLEQEISYTADSISMKGFLVYDTAMEGTRPGVLVVHEWWGHNEHARNTARKHLRQSNPLEQRPQPHTWRTREDPLDAIWPRALEMLRRMPGVGAAVMSGSGATCVGVVPDIGTARQVARVIQVAEMGWWVAPVQML